MKKIILEGRNGEQLDELIISEVTPITSAFSQFALHELSNKTWKMVYSTHLFPGNTLQSIVAIEFLGLRDGIPKRRLFGIAMQFLGVLLRWPLATVVMVDHHKRFFHVERGLRARWHLQVSKSLIDDISKVERLVFRY